MAALARVERVDALMTLDAESILFLLDSVAMALICQTRDHSVQSAKKISKLLKCREPICATSVANCRH
jgi:hypothetical protein